MASRPLQTAELGSATPFQRSAASVGAGAEGVAPGWATGGVEALGTRRKGAKSPPGRSESWRMPSTERSFQATNNATSANMTVGRSISGIVLKLLAAWAK